ncbi:MAG: BatD family protein [Alphaproteobacteria bacterium]|nr:BatD family protein [Alphaproteobacteria bacterium]
MFKKVAFIWCFLLMSVVSASAGTLTSDVDNAEVAYGNPVLLTISYEGSDGNAMQPDLSVLQDKYTIYSTANSTSMQFINGQSMQRREWRISLMPKTEGKQTIPAVSVGKYATSPIEINVLAAGLQPKLKKPQNKADQKSQTPEFKVQLTVDNENPYVQQQVNAVLTIYDNVRQSGGLTLQQEPEFLQADDWIIKKLRQPTVDDNNGQREIKFYYALFPQKSGVVELPIAKVDGFYLVYDENDLMQQNVGGFFKLLDIDIHPMFQQQKTVTLTSHKDVVSVKPIAPENGDNWWLPSSAVSLYAAWENENPQFKVGETIARNFVLTAAGVAETQLPNLEFPESPNIKQYPENPQTESVISNDVVYSKSTVRVVYIPQDSGMQTLPEVKVAWFDVLDNKMQYAVVPATTIKVLGDKKHIKAAAENMAANSAEVKMAPHQTEQAISLPIKNDENAKIKVVLLAVSAFCAGLLISFLLLRKRDEKEDDKAPSEYLDAVYNSLKNKDYRGSRDNILAWAGKTFSDVKVNNLDDVAGCINDAGFAGEMEKLNGILYADKIAVLDDNLIIDVLKKTHKKKKTAAPVKPLPDLYK